MELDNDIDYSGGGDDDDAELDGDSDEEGIYLMSDEEGDSEQEMHMEELAMDSQNRQRRARANLPLIPPASEMPPLTGDLAEEIERGSRIRSNPRSNVNQADALYRREMTKSAFKIPERRCLSNNHLPGGTPEKREQLNSRGYNAVYSPEGDIFIAGMQDKQIKVYDCSEHDSWRARKNVEARLLRWTITDVEMLPQRRLLLYSSINSTLHSVSVGNAEMSVSNVTETHEALEVAPEGEWNSFGIWSFKCSPHGAEIVAGTSDNAVCVFDVDQKKTHTKYAGHFDDVNAVEYMDENVILSGSDDETIKIWDKRVSRTVGNLIGHTEGITSIDARGDGRFLLSNSKDQTIKVWDLRKSVPTSTARAQCRNASASVPQFQWDYRWMRYPARGHLVTHPHDSSLQTLRGHTVLQTLIRAKFSPSFSTGNRYVYSGSADGKVYLWDIVTGQLRASFPEGRDDDGLIRDVDWHPTRPEISCVTWSGEVLSFSPSR